ncbi:zinc-dependent peptidase [Maribacter chungangensis]|uniref:Zinc-dependent peptidase n=1 Tax=Maribacter chungangensis TaxID=1069117 RepID=A0ABW3B1T5_9FLAO
MEILVDIFAIGCLVSIFGYFLYIVYYTLDLFFLNPFVHILPLTEKEKRTIEEYPPFYNTLNGPIKKKFEKRVVRFRHRKQIHFHNDVKEVAKIRLLLSATGAMLTLGMADFLILSIEKIIVYPSKYYSAITKRDHYGEYNRGLKTIIFSAEQLVKGFRIPNDNINLAVHEFAHALSFNVVNKLNVRSFFFIFGMQRMKRVLSDGHFLAKWEASGYFRAYGKTNVHEFFAVALESFIETPKTFEHHFPQLFKMVRAMLNMGFYRLP